MWGNDKAKKRAQDLGGKTTETLGRVIGDNITEDAFKK